MSSTPSPTRPAALAWWALALASAVLAFAHARVTVVGPDADRFTFDSAEYALAGRAWLETGRLVTPFVYPALLGSAPGPPFPLLAGHPLVPALDALAFALAGPTPDASLLPSMLAFVACVLVTARLALALSGSFAATLAAAAAFATLPWTLGFACEGRTEMPFAALLTAALLLLWELPSKPRPLVLGIVLGLAHLTRPVVAPLLPGIVLGFWLLAPSGQRARLGLRALAGFLPLASLTVIYRWATTGDPFADAGSYLVLTGITPDWPVVRLNRMLPPPDALAWVREHPGLFAEKLARNLRSISYGAWTSAGRWTGALAVLAACLAVARGGARERGFTLARVAMSTLVALAAAATVADPRMLFPLLPVGAALAFAAVVRALERRERLRVPVLALVAAVAVLTGAAPVLRQWRAPAVPAGASPNTLRASEWRELGTALAPLLPNAGLVASDAGPWIAWHTRRPATEIPIEPAELLTWPERLRPEAVVLTNEYMIHQPLEGAWR